MHLNLTGSPLTPSFASLDSEQQVYAVQQDKPQGCKQGYKDFESYYIRHTRKCDTQISNDRGHQRAHHITDMTAADRGHKRAMAGSYAPSKGSLDHGRPRLSRPRPPTSGAAITLRTGNRGRPRLSRPHYSAIKSGDEIKVPLGGAPTCKLRVESSAWLAR